MKPSDGLRAIARHHIFRIVASGVALAGLAAYAVGEHADAEKKDDIALQSCGDEEKKETDGKMIIRCVPPRDVKPL